MSSRYGTAAVRLLRHAEIHVAFGGLNLFLACQTPSTSGSFSGRQSALQGNGCGAAANSGDRGSCGLLVEPMPLGPTFGHLHYSGVIDAGPQPVWRVMQVLFNGAAFHSKEKIVPSNCAIKRLENVMPSKNSRRAESSMSFCKGSAREPQFREQRRRRRKGFAPDKVARKVAEAELKAVLVQFAPQVPDGLRVDTAQHSKRAEA